MLPLSFIQAVPVLITQPSGLGRALCRKGRVRACDRAPEVQKSASRNLNGRLTRRTMVQQIAMAIFATPLAVHAGLDYPELHGLDEKQDNLPPFHDVNGVKIQEVMLGTGPLITPGAKVSIQYVLRRSNGYFIDASYGFDRFETFPFRFGRGQVIAGFEIGVDGMREGGRRRFVVPPSLGYVHGAGKKDAGPIPPDYGARRSIASHAREPLIFEVLVVRVKPVAV